MRKLERGCARLIRPEKTEFSSSRLKRSAASNGRSHEVRYQEPGQGCALGRRRSRDAALGDFCRVRMISLQGPHWSACPPSIAGQMSSRGGARNSEAPRHREEDRRAITSSAALQKESTNY